MCGAALTPLALWLGNKFSIERAYLGRNLTVHFALSFLIAALQLVILQLINSLTLNWAEAYQPPVPFMTLVVGLVATNVMNCWIVIGISQSLTYFRRFKEREVSLAKAQLQAIHPPDA